MMLDTPNHQKRYAKHSHHVPFYDDLSKTKKLNLETLAFVMLWMFIFTIPWERSIAVAGVGALGRLIGLFAVAAGLFAIVYGGKLKLRTPSLLLLTMAAYVVWAALSFFWSIAPSNTLGRAITYGQLLAMVYLVWHFGQGSGRYLTLMQAYVMGAYVSIGAAFLAFFGGDASVGASRFSGFGDNPNWFAIALALSIPMAWQLTLSRRSNILFWLNILVIPLALVVIGLTASRGGFLVSLAALSVIPLTLGHLGLWRKMALLAIMAGGLYGMFNLIPERNLERLSDTSEQLTEGTLTGRRVIWQAGLEAFEMSPFVGYGSGSFNRAVEPFLGSPKGAHNTFISILVELGLIGLSLFLLSFLVVAIPLLYLAPPARTVCLILMLTLVIGLSPASWDYHKATWFVLVLLSLNNTYVLSKTSDQRLQNDIAHHNTKAHQFGMKL